jgi:hypothetical protein
MTDKSAAIDGDYSNFQLVQSRKVCRITVEFPIERAGEVIRLLGFPAPHSTTRCAVALLNDAAPLGDQGKAAGDAPTREDGSVDVAGKNRADAALSSSPAAPKSPRAPRKWEDMPLPEQVGLRCQETKFWRYIGAHNGIGAADKVRSACVVLSRKEILPGTAAGQTWMNIERDYQAWQKAPSMGVEI